MERLISRSNSKGTTHVGVILAKVNVMGTPSKQLSGSRNELVKDRKCRYHWRHGLYMRTITSVDQAVMWRCRPPQMHVPTPIVLGQRGFDGSVTRWGWLPMAALSHVTGGIQWNGRHDGMYECAFIFWPASTDANKNELGMMGMIW